MPYFEAQKMTFCTAGYCTHEDVHLAEGLVMGHIIECPGYYGQFDYRTGELARSLVCEALKTYPVKVEDGFRLFNVYNKKKFLFKEANCLPDY